jgi:hypothetical protein
MIAMKRGNQSDVQKNCWIPSHHNDRRAPIGEYHKQVELAIKIPSLSSNNL